MTGICLLSAINSPMISRASGADQTTPKNPIELMSMPFKSDTASVSPYNIKCVKIYPETVKQGETALITVKSSQHLKNPYYLYGDKKIPIYQENDSVYSSFVATDPNTKAGKNQIILRDETRNLCDTLNLEVKKVDFGIQNVTLSNSVSKLKATDDEKEKISKALETKSDTAYFVNPPYDRPTAGPLSSIYGKRRYNNKLDTHRFHNGIDIRAPKGQCLKTIQPGKVLVAQQFALNGGTVIVDHGHGMTSAYLHMSKIGVKVGQMVNANEVLGKVGSTGHSSGPHLHFGIYINGTPVNPESWLKQANRKTKVALKSAVKHIR